MNPGTVEISNIGLKEMQEKTTRKTELINITSYVRNLYSEKKMFLVAGRL